MSNFKFDNHGELPTGLHEITNTSSQPERVYTQEEIQQAWDGLKNAMAPVVRDLAKLWDKLRQQVPLMNLIAQEQAISNGDRYWHDHQGQPRRNPTMRPLLHNGKAPR